MDAATTLQIKGALTTLVAPAFVVIAGGLVARKLKPDAETRPLIGGLLLLLGALTAYLGISPPSLPPTDADHWTFIAMVTAGGLGLAIDHLQPKRRHLVVLALVLGVGGLFMWRLLAPLASLWALVGAAPRIAESAWVVDAAALAIVGWLATDHAASKLPAPAVLGPLAVALAAAGALIGLSGSARIGQLAGGIGVATGVAGLFAWRFPKFKIGSGAVASAYIALAMLVIFSHFYGELPRPGAALLLVLPGVSLVATGLPSTLKAVGAALAPAGLLAGLAGWLVFSAAEMAPETKLKIREAQVQALELEVKDLKADTEDDDGPDYSTY